MKRTASLILLAAACLMAGAAAAAPGSGSSAAGPSAPSVPYSWVSPDKDNPHNVAVFRDILPWADDRVDQILMAHGISFTVFGSASIGVVDLESYDKVILASSQPDTFVQKVTAYRSYFNAYADNGGYLLCSLSQQSYAMPTGTLYPGGTQLTLWATHNAVVITEPDHPVFHTPNFVTNYDLSGWGSSTHGELAMSGGTMLLRNDNGTPALMEREYGFGFVMATTQTFEYPGADWEAAENLVLHRFINPDLPLRVAIFRDQLPWGQFGVDQVLIDHDIPYTVFGSADMGLADLSEFDKVMLENAQTPGFIAAVLANRAYFEDYAAAGGVLVNGMAQYSSYFPGGEVYPGDVLHAEFVGSYSAVFLAPTHGLFNTPNTIAESDLDFNYTSHGHVTAPGAAYLAASTVDEPGGVLIEQGFGAGAIISTTLTYPLLDQPFTENLVLYMPRDFPALTGVVDVANDQGRQVRLTWNRCGYDALGSSVPILGYEIHRLQGAEKEAGWDYVMTVPAHGDAVYQAVVPTLCDSTIADGLCPSTFKVKAVTPWPLVCYESQPADGYSVDNLAPAAPVIVALAGGLLHWNEPVDADFDYFTVYGSNTPDLAGAAPVGHTTGTSLDVLGSGYAFLLVTATDFAGNESAPAVTPASTPAGELPAVFRLTGAVPNPFNPQTEIRFELPGERVVELCIYDAAGRSVRRLLHGDVLPAGSHAAAWDGRDDHGRTVAAGVYLYTLNAGADTGSGRMVLLK